MTEILFSLIHFFTDYLAELLYVMLFVMLILFNLTRIIQKLNKISSTVIVCLAAVTASLSLLYLKALTGTTFMSQMIFACIITATIYSLGVIELPRYSFALLFASTIVAAGFHFNVWPVVIAIYTFGILCLLTWLEKGHLKNHFFAIWMSMILSMIIYLIYDYLNQNIIQYFTYYLGRIWNLGLIGKTAVWLIIFILFITLMLAAVRLFRRLCPKLIEDIKLLGRNHIVIGREYFLISFLILLSTYFLDTVISVAYSDILHPKELDLLIYSLNLLVLMAQTAYMALLIKLARARVTEEEYKREKQNLLLYNSSLSKNLQEIRGIKHDIKNIFYTMGEYVNRSTDNEMKTFYYEKIAPFASQELLKNDLHMKLQAIHEEEFRAFFYYKLNQAISYDLNVEMDIQGNPHPSMHAVSFTDIIRILGIYLDNGIEEASNTMNKTLILKIVQTGDMESYTIANSIRSLTQEKGILSGTTTKGLGRGNGLLIAGEISQIYPNMIISSYFNANLFYQNITIYPNT